MEKAAIVILNYNGRHFLEKFLPGVIRHSKGYPVYVADNHSTDNSLSFLEEHFPTLTLIRLDQNYGFSGGYNRCLSKIDSEYYILLNSDVEVTPNWIGPLIDLMDNHPEIGACQPKLLEYNRKDFFEYAGAAGGWIDRFGYPFCRGRIFRTMERDFGQYDDTVPVFWASGACMCVRAKAFHEQGGFDEDFFAHMEEIDLCWRMQLSGYQIYYTAESKIYHVGGGTLTENNPFKNYLNFRNSFITLIKNSDKRNVFMNILVRFMFDLVAAVKFLITDTPANAWAVLRADLNILAHFKYYYRKRVQVSKCVRLAGKYNKSIVLSYHLYGKKYFFNLLSIVPDPVVSSS